MVECCNWLLLIRKIELISNKVSSLQDECIVKFVVEKELHLRVLHIGEDTYNDADIYMSN